MSNGLHICNKIVKVGLILACWIFPALGGPAFSDSFDQYYALRTDWSQSLGKINISAFLFNDLNENGIYDLGDRAMSDVAVGLGQDDAPLAAARSNANGFANFEASITTENAPLSTPGMYEFVVLTPPGWRVTSDNAAQTRELVFIEGSNAGVGLREMLTPIGLTRYKFIRGTYLGTEPGNLVLRQGGQIIVDVSLAPDEQFLWPVEQGEYTLETNGQLRPVTVGANPVDIGQVGLVITAPNTGRQIDFEGGAPTGLNKIPNGYGGLNWFNLNIMQTTQTRGSIGYVNGATSGNSIVYTSSGHPSRIYADAPFDFISINLTAGWPESEGELATFAYYRGDTFLFEDVIGLSAFGPISYQPLAPGVTRIEISTRHYWQMVIDDVVVSTAR